MDIATLLSADRTCISVEAGSKKRLLELFASSLADSIPELEADDLFTSLMAREKLGSTGLGAGVAIPHCRAHNCTRAYGALFRLATPLDFDAVDNAPVDLAFALVVPEEAHSDHLSALSAIAEQFQHPEFRNRLRGAGSSAELFKFATINSAAS